MGVDNVYLGAAPTVTGGIPPFTYTWTCNYSLLNMLFFTASDFLDDTTSANPQLLEFTDDSLAFYLTVSDALGNTCADSVTVRFCGNFVMTMVWKYDNINQGDSTILFPSIAQGCDPLSIEWFPNYNISDPSSWNPIAWPDTNTQYYSIVTDAAGCQANGGTFDVFVSPLSTGGSEHQISAINIFPNPLAVRSTISVSSGNVLMLFYDVWGRQVFETRTNGSTELLRSDFKTAGIYFYAVFKEDSFIGQGKLVVN